MGLLLQGTVLLVVSGSGDYCGTTGHSSQAAPAQSAVPCCSKSLPALVTSFLPSFSPCRLYLPAAAVAEAARAEYACPHPPVSHGTSLPAGAAHIGALKSVKKSVDNGVYMGVGRSVGNALTCRQGNHLQLACPPRRPGPT